MQFGDVEDGDRSFTRILVAPDGTASSKGAMTIAFRPGDKVQTVTLLDAAGKPVGETRAYFFPFSDGGGNWLIESPPAGAVAAQIEGLGTVALD